MPYRLPHWVVAAAAILACALWTPPLEASFFTELATVDAGLINPLGTPAQSPTLHVADIVQGSGQVFTNTYALDAATGGVFLRSVGVTLITAFVNNDGVQLGGTMGGPGVGTQELIVAFAIDGHTSAAAPNVATFTSGGFGVWQSQAPNGALPGSFNGTDPTTWFNAAPVPTTAQLGSSLVMSGTLAAQDDVRNGDNNVLPPSGDIPANIVNTSTLNAATGAEAQGRFLFNVGTDPGSLEALLGTQPKFLQVEPPASTPGQTPGGSGVFSLTHEFTDPVNRNTHQLPDFLNTSDKQTVVNNIAAFFGLSDLGTNQHFATFGSGTISDYTPRGVNSNGLSVTGDFSGSLKADSAVGLAATIPEPSSSALMSFGMTIVGLCLRRRKAAVV